MVFFGKKKTELQELALILGGAQYFELIGKRELHGIVLLGRMGNKNQGEP